MFGGNANYLVKHCLNKFLALLSGTNLVLGNNVKILSKPQCQVPVIFYLCIKISQQDFGVVAKDRYRI